MMVPGKGQFLLGSERVLPLTVFKAKHFDDPDLGVDPQCHENSRQRYENTCQRYNATGTIFRVVEIGFHPERRRNHSYIRTGCLW